MKASVLQHIAIIILLTVASILIHESGHFLAYRIGGIPVHVSLQSVRPVSSVNPRWNTAAKGAGPALSVIAAILLLLIARRRRTFFWVTAAFTNASLRLFPCTMDLTRALKSAHPFSDEGDVVLAFTSTVPSRVLFIAVALTIYLSLTIIAARRYPFVRHRAAKAIAIYLLSLAVGIGVVILDELLH